MLVQERGQAQLDRNTRTAIAYYTLAFNAGEPRLAVEKYVGLDRDGNKLYTQHNPFAQDGPEAFIAFVEFFKGLFPDLHVDIKRTIAQCDLVMTHAHITTSATGRNVVCTGALTTAAFFPRPPALSTWPRQGLTYTARGGP